MFLALSVSLLYPTAYDIFSNTVALHKYLLSENEKINVEWIVWKAEYFPNFSFIKNSSWPKSENSTLAILHIIQPLEDQSTTLTESIFMTMTVEKRKKRRRCIS